METKYIYIVLSKTGTMFSNVISTLTHKEYSHVSISLDNSFTKMYSFGRLNPEKMLPAGFVHENLYDGVFAMFPGSRCLIYRLAITTEQLNSLKKEIKLFEERKDKLKYSIYGTLTAYVNKPVKRDNYYFCSQFVAEILINSGIFKTDKLPEVIKPMDLLEIKGLEFLYKGLISEENYIENYYGFMQYQKVTNRILKFIR